MELTNAFDWVSLVVAQGNSTSRCLEAQGKPVFTHVGTGDKTGFEILVETAADQDFMQACLESTGPSAALALTMTAVLEKQLAGSDLLVPVPSLELRRRFGNKLNIHPICKRLGLPRNRSTEYRSVDGRLARGMFDSCKLTLGLPFIVQAKMSYGGVGTFLISTFEDLVSALPAISRGCRAARYIENSIPFSVQVCIGKDKIIPRGPFLQLIGLEGMSSDAHQYCGNDTNTALLSDDNKDLMLDASEKIGVFLQEDGYKGLFGIDFLLDPASDEICVQEINPRITGLTNLICAIQNDQKAGFDIIKHLEAFDVPQPDFADDHLKSGDMDLDSQSYCQAHIYNITDQPVTIPTERVPGIFDLKDGALVPHSSALCVSDMVEGQVLVTYFPDKDQEIEAGGSLCRFMLKNSMTSTTEYAISDWGQTALDALKRYILEPAP